VLPNANASRQTALQVHCIYLGKKENLQHFLRNAAQSDLFYTKFRLFQNFIFLCSNNLQEMGSEGMEWIELAHDRERRRALVNAVMNLRVP